MHLLPLVLLLQIGFDSGVDRSPKVTIDGAIQKRAGDVVEGVITARIADGWHINSNQPTESYAIPTVLTLENAELIKAVYPKHEMRSFQFTEGKAIAVYTGAVQIPFSAHAKGSFHATVRYQACSDRICLPPNKAEGDIALSGGPTLASMGGDRT